MFNWQVGQTFYSTHLKKAQINPQEVHDTKEKRT